MDHDKAEEFFEYNVIGAWMGEGIQRFVTLTNKNLWGCSSVWESATLAVLKSGVRSSPAPLNLQRLREKRGINSYRIQS